MSHDMRDTSGDLSYEEMERARGPFTAGDSRVEGIQPGMDKLESSLGIFLEASKKPFKKGFKDTERD